MKAVNNKPRKGSFLLVTTLNGLKIEITSSLAIDCNNLGAPETKIDCDYATKTI